MIAARLSYIVKHYKLLPENHSGARPKQSAEQALNLVNKKIYEAWKEHKVLTLVTSDVKGASNEVRAHVLEQRLRARRVSEPAVQWIRNFCSQRRVQVSLGSYEPNRKTSSIQASSRGHHFHRCSASSTMQTWWKGRPTEKGDRQKRRSNRLGR